MESEESRGGKMEAQTKRTKWLIKSCRKGIWAASATKDRGELKEFFGIFISDNFDRPGETVTEIKLQFWAAPKCGKARMRSALGKGYRTADELKKEMLRVQP
jgi:hypothetical protein